MAIFFTGTPSDGTSYSICSHCFQSIVKASVVGLYDCESLCACRKKQTHQDTRRAQHGKAGAEGGSELVSLIRPDIECCLRVSHRLGLKGGE